MSRFLVCILAFFLSGSLFAGEIFWVGGSGKWSDANHWSLKSGGSSSGKIPGPTDRVIIDNNSGLKEGEYIFLESSVSIYSISFYPGTEKVKIAVPNNAVIETISEKDYSALNPHLISRDWIERKAQENQKTNNPPPVPATHTCSVVVITDNLCPGQCNGVAQVVVNPPGNYTYFWFPSGQTTQTATGLCTGQGYIVQVTDVNNPADVCQAGIIMTNYLPFGSFFNNVNVTCNGQCTGQSTINVIGGTAPYQYSWNPTGQTTQVATGLCAGTYTITVTDANNCTYTTTTTITQPTPIQPNPSQTNILCNPNCDGVATVSPTGGTPPYSYSWNTVPAQTTSSATGLCAGSYTVTITDANNCTRTQAFTITQPAQPLGATTSTSGNPVPCFSNCTATGTVTASGGTPGYTYSWNPSGQTNATATGLCAGTYTVTVTDANGCTLTRTITITEPPQLTLSINSSNNPLLCNGLCNATGTANPGGGTAPYTYLWNPGGQTTQIATGLCAGTYTLTVTDANNCTISQTLTVTEPPPLTVSTATFNSPVQCFGDCNASASATPSGGTPSYTYNWMPGAQTTQTATGLCAGTYTVTVTDANGCTNTSTVTITSPPQLTVTISTTNNPLPCNSVCNGTATANPSGGIPGYNYNWSNGQTTQTATGLCAGTYTVTISDANGCTRSTTVTFTQPNALTLTTTSTALQCFNQCTATLGVNALGGTAPFTYLWSPVGQTTATITGQCAGTYTITVTDANGCTNSATIVVNQPSQMNIFTTGNNPSCNNLCNGSASALAGGGNPPYSYSWAPGGQTTQTITGLCAGTYTVTVTDANGCTATSTVQLTQPTPIVPGVTTQNALCNGQCNGSATSNPSGGTGPYTYLWQPSGATTASITGLCVGNYTVTVTDANGCTGNQVVSIQQPPTLNVNISAATTACNICNGSATANPIGGTSPYSYNWSNGQTTQTATGLCPGQYTVTVTDANGCTATTVANIVQTVQILITTSGNTLNCFGDCNGIATANAAGGALPYSYLWSTNPIQTTQSATGLCAGTYTVTVTDANGCFGTGTVTFSNPPALTLSTTFTNVSCNNNCVGTATATAGGGTPGYTYLWTPGGQTTVTATGLCAGTYTVVVSDANNCTISSTVTISQPPPLTINPTINQANCTLCDGSIVLNESGGNPPYTFVWAPNVSNSNSATGLCPGTYTVTITDNTNCTATFTISLGNIQGPTLVMAFTPASCNGACDGAASVLASGGTPPYTYLWNPGGQTTVNATGLCAGTYTVQVTDAPGCISFGTITVTQPQPLVANATVGNSTCGSNCNGFVNTSVTGGTGPYSYNWQPGNLTTPNVSGLCAGTYTLVITDANNCTASSTHTINAPPALSVSVSATNVNCFNNCDGTATATPSGGTPGYTYLWTPGNFSTQNLVFLCPGTYTVVVTDANNCTASATVTITQPPQLTLSFVSSTPPSCNNTCNGTATVSASGGTPAYSYLWTPGNFTGATVNTLCGQTYTITVTDANGCTATLSISLTAPPPVIPNATTFNVSCNGACNGAATSNPSGGTGGPYTYLWMPGNLTSQTVNGLCTGTYTLTVTDGNGCTGSTIFTITSPTVLQPGGSIVSLPSCASNCNGSLTSNPVGGSAPYSYLWNPGGITTQTATGLCAGTYTLTVTDVNGCVGTQTIVLNNPSPITIISAVGQANCGTCNGTINIAPSGGTAPYTYLWSPGGMTTQNVTGLCAGLYTVVITDATGCTRSFTIGVSNTSGPTLTMSATGTTCFGGCDGTASVSANGASPFTYQWSPGGATTTSITGLCSGSYTVVVTDANNCITVDSVFVPSPPQIQPNATVVNAQCSGICTGSITLNPSGGNGGPYSYLWQPGNMTTASINNLCVGTYTVTISDAMGCTTTATFTISGNTVITFSLSNTNIICSGSCTGTATVSNPIGGSIPYSYSWSDPFGQFTSTATGLCVCTYTVTVTDANGCFTTGTVTITQTAPVVANPTISAPSCGQCNGSISLNPSGGSPPFTYQWNTGQTTQNITGVCAGIYNVTITGSNGCSVTVNIPVSNANGPLTNLTTTPNACFGDCNATASSNPSGGTPPYSYFWSPGGQTTNSLNNLCNGTYYLQVTDGAGCITTDSFTIQSSPQIITNQLITHTACGTCNGSIALSPTGGQSPYTYLWQPGNQTTSSITGLCAGNYSVTVTDANGCTQTAVIAVSNSNGPSVTLSLTHLTCNSGCTGSISSVVTGGSPPYAYLWSNGATTTSVNALCAGTYTLTVTDGANCVSNAIVQITQPPQISFSAPIVSQPLCNNDCNGSITVIPNGGTPPFTYAWSNGATTSGLSNLCPGSYTVTVTDVNNCSSSLTVVLNNPPPLVISNVVTTNSSCNTVNDGSIDITVSGGVPGYTYSWSNGATTQDLTNVLSGTYTVVVTDANNCTTSTIVSLLSNVSVVANAGTDTTFCEGGGIVLNGSGSVNALTYQWLTVPGNAPVGNTAIVNLTNPGVGTWTYALIVSNGACSDTDTVVITINPNPIAEAGPNQTIVIFNSVIIGGNPTGPLGSTYAWSPAISLDDGTLPNPTASPTVTTVYTVTVTNASGCTATDTVRVTVLPKIIFPNGISPNGDGSNDMWIIDNIHLFPNNWVEVYNRWGQLLFRGDGYDNVNVVWDGTYKGKPVPVGTYYYIINLNDPLYPDAFTGPITVYR